MRRIFKFLNKPKPKPESTNNPVVSETTVEAFLDTVATSSGKSQADPLGALVAHVHRCAALVAAAPGAYSPVQLAHTVAAVAAQLAQMGDATHAHVVAHWPSRGAALADPAADHLWKAVEQLALTAGLMDVALPTQPATGHAITVNPLAALVETAVECTKQVCTSDGEPVAGPAEVARAIAQTLASLEPLFAPVHSWIVAYVPGRGRDLPQAARHHLAEATGRWAPISGLITHVPADPRPEPEAPAEEQASETPEPATVTTANTPDESSTNPSASRQARSRNRAK